MAIYSVKHSMNKFKQLATMIIMACGMLVWVTACQKNEVSTDKQEEENNYYQEINDINVLDKNATKFIDEEITSDSRIVFSADTPEDAIPKVGTGIFIPESEKAPYGMLSRVLSVNKDSERTVVTTEPLPLADAFESLSIDSSSPWETTLEGVFNEDGNPVEYEIVGKPGEATRSTDFELTENGLSIPVRTGQESGDGSYSIAGNVGIFFDKFDLSIDIDKHGVNGISLVAAPSLEVDFGGNVELKAERERVIELFRKQIHTVRFKIRIPTPVAGIPIIIPVRISFDCLFEASGTVAWGFGVKYKNTLDCKVEFENGKWSSEAKSVKNTAGNPWTVTQNLGVDGEIDLGVKVGILAGLYTTNLGIGVYATPKVYLGGEAKLDSEDLYKVNPSLEYGLKISSEVFAIAKLFGKDLGKYNVELPDYTIWSKALPLLPSLSGFEAKKIAGATKSANLGSPGKQVSVEIGWRQDPEYFLSSKDVKTGVAIFNKASGTEVASFMPAPESESDGSYSYKTTVRGLSTDSTYYAKTFAYWDGYKKFGKDNDIDTKVRKLISEVRMSCADGYSVTSTFKYDEKGRLSYRHYTEREPESGAWSWDASYSYDNGYVREVNPNDNDCWYRFSNGYVVESYNGENRLTNYKYEQDKAVRADGLSYYYSWNWNDGDLVYLHFGGEGADDISVSYTFYDIENKMNIDFYDIWEDRFDGLFCFDRSVFPMFSSQHLLKSSSENHSYTYDIDDNGDVTGMTVYAGGEKYHVSIDYY